MFESALAGQVCGLIKHMVQTQWVYHMACTLISFIYKCLYISVSKKRAGIAIATVVNFVAVRASRFNSFQHPKFSDAESKGVPRGEPGRAPGLELRFQRFIEVY